MYRTASRPAVDPSVDLVLLTWVSSARLRHVEAWLTIGVFFPLFILAGALLGRTPIAKIGPLFLALPIALVCFGLRAYVRQRRVRVLTIERREKEVRLRVERTSIDLPFPVSVRGEQHTYQSGRIESHALYLQVIGAEGRSAIFVENRGRSQGREPGWPSDGIDRSVPHEELDLATDVGASIVELRDVIAKTNGGVTGR